MTDPTFHSAHCVDDSGNPAGGITTACGITIEWQNGPLGRGTERREPNGAFVETVIDAALDRLFLYQGTKFACEENARAIQHLVAAKNALEDRTRQREARAVEGTHQQ